MYKNLEHLEIKITIHINMLMLFFLSFKWIIHTNMSFIACMGVFLGYAPMCPPSKCFWVCSFSLLYRL
jgi:hypothetical protein